MLKRQRQEEHKSKVAGGGDLALVGARSWIPSPAPEEKKEKKSQKQTAARQQWRAAVAGHAYNPKLS